MVCYTQAGMYFVLQVALVQNSEAGLYLYFPAPGSVTSCCQLCVCLPASIWERDDPVLGKKATHLTEGTGTKLDLVCPLVSPVYKSSFNCDAVSGHIIEEQFSFLSCLCLCLGWEGKEYWLEGRKHGEEWAPGCGWLRVTLASQKSFVPHFLIKCRETYRMGKGLPVWKPPPGTALMGVLEGAQVTLQG